MKYYIDKVRTWGPANRKCAELHQEMKQYENCLVADVLSRDALVEQVRQTVDALNAAYPRTKPLKVDVWHDGVSVHPEPRISDSDTVCAFDFCPVRRGFHFTENYMDGKLTIGGELRECNELNNLKKTE